jgi:hypothetical protein
MARASVVPAMRAFDELFPEVARHEGLDVQVRDPQGQEATFRLREYYCTEPGCACRRVVVMAESTEKRRVVAAIHYSLARPRRRGQETPFLDPESPRNELAEALLAAFSRLVREDRGYRDQIRRHLDMCRRAASAAPAARGARAVRAASAAAVSQSLQLLGPASKDESGSRRRFRRLLDRVEKLRRAVRTWRDARAPIDREIALYIAEREAFDRLRREIVRAMDRAHAQAKLSKAERATLGDAISSLAMSLREEGEDDGLEAIIERHAGAGPGARMADDDAASVEALKEMMESLGLDFGDADLRTLEDIEAFVGARSEAERRAAEAEEAERGRRARRSSSTTAKQRAAQARREREAQDASRALQDVYRRLAMALHPDREPDADERARKTELMQEINAAYRARDLLALLELELRLERVDAARIEAIAEERLDRYNRILREQVEKLSEELGELELPWRLQLDLGPRARLSPDRVMAEVRADAGQLKQQAKELRQDLAMIKDTSRLKVWLRALRSPRGRRSRIDDMFG